MISAALLVLVLICPPVYETKFYLGMIYFVFFKNPIKNKKWTKNKQIFPAVDQAFFFLQDVDCTKTYGQNLIDIFCLKNQVKDYSTHFCPKNRSTFFFTVETVDGTAKKPHTNSDYLVLRKYPEFQGQTNEIIDLEFFSLFEPAWATDQLVKIFSILVKFSLR